MTKVAVVFHSGSGHTKVQAEAVFRGAAGTPGAHATLVSVDELADTASGRWGDLDEADAIIFGSPTYMGGPSAAFKAFLDATSGRWATERWKDKLAAGFTNSAGLSGDKLATLEQFAVVAAQHGMIWVGLGLLPGNEPGSRPPDELNRLASFLGAMAQSDPGETTAIAPPLSDLLTAEHLGARVAQVAARWRRGHDESDTAAEKAPVEKPPGRLSLLRVLALLWAVAVLVWIGLLGIEALTSVVGESLSCELAQDSSVYGTAEWSWIPPGRSCHWQLDHDGGVLDIRREPPIARLGTALILTMWGGSLWSIGRHQRRNEDATC